MKSIILAAGRGTRMGDLTLDTPKPMLPVRGKPKLAWSIENLPEQIDEVVLVVGYLKEQVVDYFGDEYDGRKIIYVEQEVFNGSAGALDLVNDLIGEDEKFLITMGDDFYTKEDLEKLLKYDYALLALDVENAQPFGLLAADEDENLVSVIERPHDHDTGRVSIAGYILKKDYFDTEMVQISEKEFGLPQTIVKMSQDTGTKIKVVKANNWFAVGDPEAYEEAQERYKNFID